MTAQVSDELWQDFHTVVNMTSRELEDWLRTQSAQEAAEAVPDQAGPPAGRHVVEILGKRRVDLTEKDADVMREVVRIVRTQRDEQLDPKAGGADWRHHLMNLGHDPLKPVTSRSA